MQNKQLFVSAIPDGFSFVLTLSTLLLLLLPFSAQISFGPPESQPAGFAVSWKEFEALNSTVVAALNSTVVALNLTVTALKLELDVLLTLLARDGPFAVDFQSGRGQRGVQDPPEPVANSTEILVRLEELEKFRDNVELAVAEDPTVIYFATNGSGIRVYSEATNQMETLVGSTEDLEGVAWDDENEQLHSSPDLSIYTQIERSLRLYLDPEGRFRQNKRSHPRLFYALSDKAIFVKIGPPVAELLLTNGIPVKILFFLNISATIGHRPKRVAPFERAREVALGNRMRKYLDATRQHPIPGIAEVTDYCSHSTIHRVNGDGAEVHAVFNGTEYEEIRGLAIDWITGNLYGVGTGGCVFVCQTATSDQINCRTLLSGQGSINGIALDPNRGTLYYTKNEGSITMAAMDGTNAVYIITGLDRPAGIVLGFNPLRLFWVDHATDRVKSSNLEGTDIRQVAHLPSGTYPWGIAINNDRIYLGNYASKSLQTTSKTGENVQTLCSGTHEIQQLTVTTSNPVRTRPNHCNGQGCTGICVLNTNSFRCLS